MLHGSCLQRNAQTAPDTPSCCWFVSLTAYSQCPFGWTTTKDGLATPANEPRTVRSPVAWSNAEFVNCKTCQLCPTDWIQKPMLERIEPNQKKPKLFSLKGCNETGKVI